MIIGFSGTVHYANGDPIANVTVRVFDRDESAAQDDDLTVTAGLSDEHGHFNLTYEPLRYLDQQITLIAGGEEKTGEPKSNAHPIRMPDIGDRYLPYLRFNYTYKDSEKVHMISLGFLQADFYLPVNPPVKFLPSRDGFKFVNSFAGYFMPYSTPAFLASRKISSTYGLCGGMCASAYDFLLAGRPIPPTIDVPRQGTALQRYLFRRQMDSLGGLGKEAVKVAQWTSLPDGTPVGTMRRTLDEFNEFRPKLDEGNLVILALIYEHATSLKELSRLVFNNHQVLAYAYQQSPDGSPILHIYDPNLPGRDDVVIRSETVQVGEVNSTTGVQPLLGLKSTELTGGAFYKNIRGFFQMPYSPEVPPAQ